MEQCEMPLSILTSQWGKIKIFFSLFLALSSTSLFSFFLHLVFTSPSALAEKERAFTSLENKQGGICLLLSTSFWSPSKEEKPRRCGRMLGLKGVNECQK